LSFINKQRTGRLPTRNSGPVDGAEGETWYNVNAALRDGWRGLPGGDSLFRLLVRRRGLGPISRSPALTEAKILRWADAWRTRTGRWPKCTDGSIPSTDGETWAGVSNALHRGWRGLPGGNSLARLLRRERGVRNVQALPPLTEARILKWAKAHRRRTGRWPTYGSGSVKGAPGEVWRNIDHALQRGGRGLPGGDTLSKLLARRLRVLNRHGKPRLTEEVVLAWADAHKAYTGAWPTTCSGGLADAPGETWRRIDVALSVGLRGLPGGSSLMKLLVKRRSAPDRSRR
jgi:hypothetical protein